MEHLQALLRIAILCSVGAVVLAMGLDASREDLLSVVRRPGKLARAFLAISVIVPATAVLVTSLLPLSLPAQAGLILMSLSPVPPVTPRKGLQLGGSKAYVYGLYATFAFLTLFIVPISVWTLNRILGARAEVSLPELGRLIIVSVLIPLALGLAIRARWPRTAIRLAPRISTLGFILLLIAVLPILVKAWPAMMEMLGNGILLGIVAIVSVAILAGSLLGGPNPGDRAALAGAAAIRHPGIALMIAKASWSEKGPAAAIVLFLIVSALAVMIYQMALKRILKGRPAPPEPSR
jgi:BASS family bile acid:Na+ symporter